MAKSSKLRMATKRKNTKQARLLHQRRWSLNFALVFIVVIVGYLGYRLVASHAATLYTTGGHVYDQNGHAVAGAGISGCGLGSTTTDANGHYQFSSSVQYYGYCIRVASLPRYYSGPVGYHNRAEHANAGSYEWQVLGGDCYQNPYCGSGGIGGNDAVKTWDESNYEANGMDFRVTYAPPPPPTPHGCGAGTLNDQCPPPAPTGSGTSGGGTSSGGSRSSGGTRSSGGNSRSQSGQASPAPAVPSTPSNFTANSNVVGAVLNWSASSGGNGDISYNLDRSTDQQSWTSVATAITGTVYVDTGTSFGTQYFYRLQAVDSAGATSDYATAQVTTSTYSPNASSGSNQTITSDDQNVNAIIPSSAIASDAACAVVNQSSSQPVSQQKIKLVLGPYLLICRTSDGNVINSFSQPITYQVKVPDNLLKKYQGFDIVKSTQGAQNWQSAKAQFDTKQKQLTFSDSSADTFAVSAQAKTNILGYIELAIGVVVIGVLIFFGVKKKDTIVEWFYRH